MSLFNANISDQQKFVSTNTSVSSAYSSQPNSMEFLAESSNAPITKVLSEDLNLLKDSMLLDGRELHAPNFQNIHGNYAKRRYKNVESKVGRYIASIKADERKRRAAKFIRSHSAPIDVNELKSMAGKETNPEDLAKNFNANDLYKLNESASDYIDTEVMTSSGYSNSTQGGGSSNAQSRHESSDDAVNGSDFIDKHTYAQLIFEKDHLETLLDEKRSECLRHKRNVEFLRIELTNCQDELKRARTNTSGSQFRYAGDFVGFTFAARSGYSNENLNNAPNIKTKSTQTDFVVTVENLDTPKRRSTTENVLRLRSNSNSFSHQMENNNRRSSFDYSEENNAIGKARTRKVQDASPPASPNVSINLSPPNSEFTYYGRNGYVPVCTINNSGDSNIFLDGMHKNLPAAGKRRRHGHVNSFRQRLNRLFSRCTRCDDRDQSFGAYGETYKNNLELTIQSPTPLLNHIEGSRHCNSS